MANVLNAERKLTESFRVILNEIDVILNEVKDLYLYCRGLIHVGATFMTPVIAGRMNPTPTQYI